jgi:hypothetical protein
MVIKNFLILIMSFTVLVTALPQASWAQAPNETSSAPELSGTRKQVATIIFAGLAGAILGLSTLSFYGRPQEKLSNIAVGFAIGIIGGVVVTTYNVARSPYDGLQSMQINFDDELSQRLAATNAGKTFAPTIATWNF